MTSQPAPTQEHDLTRLAHQLLPGETFGLAAGQDALFLALASLTQSAIEAVYADSGDSSAHVLATNVSRALASRIAPALGALMPSPTEVGPVTNAAKALYDHWRRSSPDIGDWGSATAALQMVFLGQAQALANARMLTTEAQ